MGFGAEIESKKERDVGELFMEVMPQDLQKYGLIPEFIGRLPVVVTLHSLDKAALISILKEPKNALVKQYKKLFELDNVLLEIDDEALGAIADKAIEKKTGARGLRSIMEDIMLDVMYDIPLQNNVEKCIVSKETIENKLPPTLLINEAKKSLTPAKKKKKATNIDSAS